MPFGSQKMKGNRRNTTCWQTWILSVENTFDSIVSGYKATHGYLPPKHGLGCNRPPRQILNYVVNALANFEYLIALKWSAP